MTIKVLASDQLGNGTGMATARSLYKASSTAPMKTALIKSMRFTNVASSGSVKLNLYFVPSGSSYPTNARHILPKDQPLSSAYEILDDVELTLSPGDSIYAAATNDGSPTGAWIDIMVAGLERDA